MDSRLEATRMRGQFPPLFGSCRISIRITCPVLPPERAQAICRRHLPRGGVERLAIDYTSTSRTSASLRHYSNHQRAYMLLRSLSAFAFLQLVAGRSPGPEQCTPNCEMDFWSAKIVASRPTHPWADLPVRTGVASTSIYLRSCGSITNSHRVG